MSHWRICFTPSALIDLISLNHSQQKTIAQAMCKVQMNPLPKSEGGYGIPLGNKAGNNLTGCLEGKLRGAGLRIIYRLDREESIMDVIAIGAREDEQIYHIAAQRIR